MLGGSYRLAHKLFETPSSANAMRYFMGDIPVLGTLSRFYDNTQYTKDYNRNRGISWADYKYPTKSGVNSGFTPAFETAAGSIEKLYRDNDRRAMDNLRRRSYENSIEANNYRKAWYYSRM